MIPLEQQFRIRWSATSFGIRVTPGFINSDAYNGPSFETDEKEVTLSPNSTNFIYGDTTNDFDLEVLSAEVGPNSGYLCFVGRVVTGQTGVVSVDQPSAIVPPDGIDLLEDQDIDVRTLTADNVRVGNDIVASGIGVFESPIDMMGSGTFRHRQRVWSGGPAGKFADTADHSHGNELLIKADEANQVRYGWHNGIYTSRSGVTVYSNAGLALQLGLTAYTGTKDSIDTSGTQASFNVGEVSGVVKLRFTNSVQLDVGTVVLFQTTTAVAGIQASVYSAIVTQAPTLVGSKWEALVKVYGLDANHWSAASAANTAAQNAFWFLWFLSASEVAGGSKVSLTRDTAGPTDQLIATFGAAHNLVADQIVSLFVGATTTGLTGTSIGYFNGGYVTEVVSSTVVKVRVRNMRAGMNSFSGSTTATGAWFFFPGVRDPFHELIPSANLISGWRNQTTGAVDRVAVGGGCDVVDGVTNAAAIGFDQVVQTSDTLVAGTGPRNFMSLRSGDLGLNGDSLRTMIGCRAPAGGVRALNDGAAAGGVTTVTYGPTIGTGVYTVVAIVQMPPSAPPADRGIILLNPDSGFHGIFITDGGNLMIHTSGSAAAVSASPWFGQAVVLEMRRTTTAVELYVNGALVITHSGTGWDNTLQSTTQLRVGGAYTTAQRYNDVVYRAWLFPHLLTQSDRSFIVAHGRIPSQLQWGGVTAAYTSAFSGGSDSWVQNMGNAALTTTGNIDSVSGVDDTLRVSNTAGAPLAMQLRRDATLVVGKRYRMSFDYFAEAGSGMAFLGLGFHGLKQNTNDNLAVVEGSWQTGRLFEFTATQTSLFLFVATTAAGSSGGSIAAGKNLWLKNIAVTRLGPTVAHDFGVGVGNQVHDQSGNGYHATLFAPFDHVVPVRNGQVRQRVTASGNTQILPGIPTNARITGVTANAAGTVTLSVGNASAGTQIVNAQALSAGRQDVTLAGRFSTTGNLWANLSSAVQVDLTVHYELAD